MKTKTGLGKVCCVRLYFTDPCKKSYQSLTKSVVELLDIFGPIPSNHYKKQAELQQKHPPQKCFLERNSLKTM